MGKEYVIGDVHGAYRALKQVLDRVNFDYENDKLISVGDVTDGWSETAESIELLMMIKNLVYIKGNHDEWAERFLKHTLKHGETHECQLWLMQGGAATHNSYVKHPELVDKHIEFLSNAKLYYVDDENRIFLHAGFDPYTPLDKQHQMDVGQKEGENALFYWDRHFWGQMVSMDKSGVKIVDIDQYKEIYIGHTPTIREYPDGKPVNIVNVWNMDTGAAYSGRVTIMDINTKEFIQSDLVYELYPDEMGRNGQYLVKK